MISLEELKDILENNDPLFIENLAGEARRITIQNFGRTISLYAPLYLSNFCENHCLYCGFQQGTRIKRKRLTPGEMVREMRALGSSGIQNILLLTGESRQMTPPDYLLEAVNIAKNYFPSISLEVYPLKEEEYRELFLAGVDGLTIYQETYNQERYQELHKMGKKRDYHYRFNTPARAAKSGIRMISMGVLLGLFETAQDIYHLFLHLEWLEKNYPGVEYSLSFPRLIPISESGIKFYEVPDVTLIKLICIGRILFPRVGINLSSREKALIRDHALALGVTRISAASRTSVGGYALDNQKNPQFKVKDTRSVQEIVEMLKARDYDPVFTDWRRIPNQAR